MTASSIVSNTVAANSDLDLGNLSIRAGLALLLVVCLIMLTQILMKRLQNTTGHGRMRRLAVIENLMIDNKHRLVMIRRDDVEHLILIGAEQSLLVEGNILSVAQTSNLEHPMTTELSNIPTPISHHRERL